MGFKVSWTDGLIVGLAAVVALALVRQRGTQTDRVPSSDWSKLAESTLAIGDSDAPVRLVEFVDYRCPACRSAEGVLAGLERDRGVSVRRVIRLVPVRSGQFPDTAALAAVCASQQGRFAAMHRTLFANPDLIARASWDSLSRLSGIADSPRFFKCLRSDAARALLESDRTMGESMGVSVLPTLVLDREWISGTEPQRLRNLLLARLQ